VLLAAPHHGGRELTSLDGAVLLQHAPPGVHAAVSKMVLERSLRWHLHLAPTIKLRLLQASTNYTTQQNSGDAKLHRQASEREATSNTIAASLACLHTRRRFLEAPSITLPPPSRKRLLGDGGLLIIVIIYDYCCFLLLIVGRGTHSQISE